MELYYLMKTLHILSSTILFGFGCGTAWYFLHAHLTREPATIARVGRMVVRADWIFTGSSGLIQPATGLWLASFAGHSLDEPWLLATFLLYALALACWAPVVWLQIRATRLAEQAAETGRELSEEYYRAMRWWFALGWPALFALLGIFYLMVAKPPLW